MPSTNYRVECNGCVRIQIIDPRFVAPVPRYKIVARDPETVCADRQKYAATDDKCHRPTPPTPRCWARYAWSTSSTRPPCRIFPRYM